MFSKSFCVGLLLPIVTICYADNFSSDYIECVKNVLENEYHCVHKIDNDKIYINPENIFPTTQGVFINLNGYDHILAPQISSDLAGCFIESMGVTVDEMQISDGVMPMLPCPYCHKEFHPTSKEKAYAKLP